jgi:acylphosphatase
MTSDPGNSLTLTVHITGRVQGVAYRAWTKDEATARGLSGWVRNLPDGSVRALLHGPEARVRAMVEAMRDGPPAARVDSVDAAPGEVPEGSGFRILR